MRTHRPLLALLVLPSVALAQAAPAPFKTHALGVDSGWIDNAAATERTVFAHTVTIPGAMWLRLQLRDTNLPPRTRLKLTARRDAAVQWFDAESLRDYANGSAYFNGDAVQVELLAAPATRANRVLLHSVEAGEMPGGQVATICGSVDDRQLSTDPRQGRQHPTGCTSWLISPACVLTAGHCTASAAQQIHFNVPLSNSNGSIVLPPPQDQYPYDAATIQRLDAGIGSDWTVVTTVRNSNTRLYPGQKQGAWYTLGSVPSSPAGQNIRITGYGTRSSPANWSQVQTTHVGPLQTIAATSLCYATDTTGGNSGSPIIHENTGNPIGIHTHGGCGATSGCNSGTRIDRADIQNAVRALIDRKRAGIYGTFGSGCAGTNGTPALTAAGFPDLGANVSLEVGSVPANSAGAMLFGQSDSQWGSLTLPLALDGLGASGCSLLVSAEVGMATMSNATGRATVGFVVPRDNSLIGVRVFQQYFTVDAGANAAGFTLSNGLRGVIGD